MEDRYIVLYAVTIIQNTKRNKAGQNTNKPPKKNKQKHKNKQNQNQTPSNDVTGTSYGWKRGIKARGDSLVSSQFMHDDSFVTWKEWPQTENKNKETRQEQQGPIQRVQEATKLSAETGDPPSQDPRDHKEQPFRHDIHPDTLKQTPTTPGRNKSGEKSYRSETGEWNMV